jgi:deoxyribose-phosphate aldolase
MEKTEILKKVDLTLLSPSATEAQIIALCEKAAALGTASVCVSPCYVRTASKALNGKTKVCTVIGFPNGYNTTAVKCAEAENAIKNGADEIDTVINIGWLKDKKYDLILDEIRQIKAVCGERILKVIIETCLLDEDEKIKMCAKSSQNRVPTLSKPRPAFRKRARLWKILF